MHVKQSQIVIKYENALSRTYIQNISTACTCHLILSDAITFLNRLATFNMSITIRRGGLILLCFNLCK